MGRYTAADTDELPIQRPFIYVYIRTLHNILYYDNNNNYRIMRVCTVLYIIYYDAYLLQYSFVTNPRRTCARLLRVYSHIFLNFFVNNHIIIVCTARPRHIAWRRLGGVPVKVLPATEKRARQTQLYI